MILDIIMPDSDGAMTLDALHEPDPRAGELVAVGCGKERTLAPQLALGALGFLQKSYEIDTLTAELDRAFTEQL